MLHCALSALRMLKKDKEEAEALRQAKLLEEEKAQFSVSREDVLNIEIYGNILTFISYVYPLMSEFKTDLVWCLVNSVDLQAIFLCLLNNGELNLNTDTILTLSEPFYCNN